MLFYFTATGNCLYAARQLDDEIYSIPQLLKHNQLSFEADTIGFVVPDYAGELPLIVREFIEKATFHANYMYMVMTYGKNYSVVAKWAKAFAKAHGVHLDLVDVLLMVDNYLPAFDMQEEKAIDKKIPEQLEAIKHKIARKETGYTEPTAEGIAAYERVHARDPQFNNGSQITVTAACVGCGMCNLVCPRGNFYIENKVAKRYSETCEFCLACAHHCPRKAIKLSMGERNDTERFINEHVKVLDIIEANSQK